MPIISTKASPAVIFSLVCYGVILILSISIILIFMLVLNSIHTDSVQSMYLV